MSKLHLNMALPQGQPLSKSWNTMYSYEFREEDFFGCKLFLFTGKSENQNYTMDPIYVRVVK